jgi:hypothetical protein
MEIQAMPLANIAKSVVDVAVVGGGIDLGRSCYG